ncbi:hypothetical protein [Stutzerimonas frequens]|uniref:Uncharacterized protein n=1 Tax=Stutzerimonas frequens TaxID=2968969 RepID=A0AA47E1G6_9GAMM|nr:hypothetical protein [Stutzerimonas frequens]WAE52178.1 hypothetical protein OSV15_21365 [Stutzerimonas frequens]
MLLSRELSLFFKLDFSKIPASKRAQALQQQLLLLSPFANPGHYANWQAGRAQVWIWDQAALLERLPQAARYSVLPDSALSLNSPLLDGERLVAGIKGLEWQRWRDGQLDDSRWAAHHTTELPTHELDLSQRSPLQAADRQLLQNLGMASVATALLAALLIQIGAWLDLSRSQEQLTAQLAELEEGSQLQAQARRRALQSRDRWLTRQALFTHSQSELIARVGEALPSSASLWQRYDYQPGRLQIFLLDPSPDPRDYVRRLDETAMVDSVQVQPEPRNGMVTLQAVPFAHGGEQ